MNTSGNALTLDALKDAIGVWTEEVRPKWEQMLRGAKAVELRATTVLPDDGQMYVLDPNATALGWFVGPLDLPAVLLCRPEHEPVARAYLASIGITPIVVPTQEPTDG